jgi:hypothetical protein
MSIGSLGSVAASAAGSPLAQAKGSETERAEQDVGAQQRKVQSDQKAEAAAGIGETDGENHEPADRDADGRRPWEFPAGNSPDAEPAAHPPRPSKDTSGQSGNLLDLSG